MTDWPEPAPSLAGPWGQYRDRPYLTSADLEAQYRRAVDAIGRWDAAIGLDAHPLLQHQRDRDNRGVLRHQPDLALLVLETLPLYLDDRDLREAFQASRHWEPRVLLGLDAPRRWPPMHWQEILVRELVTNFVRGAVRP